MWINTAPLGIRGVSWIWGSGGEGGRVRSEGPSGPDLRARLEGAVAKELGASRVILSWCDTSPAGPCESRRWQDRSQVLGWLLSSHLEPPPCSLAHTSGGGQQVGMEFGHADRLSLLRHPHIRALLSGQRGPALLYIPTPHSSRHGPAVTSSWAGLAIGTVPSAPMKSWSRLPWPQTHLLCNFNNNK